jgi:hypothetical protein
MYPDLFNLCVQFRSFLEPRWFSLHQLWGDTSTERLSRYMCRYTSIFIKTVLNVDNQKLWRLVAGKPVTKEKEGTAEGCFGFRTSSGIFFDHCWVQSDNLIVDITADQFGAEEVIITSVSDSRYYPNLEEADFNQEIVKLSHHPERWLKEWNDK